MRTTRLMVLAFVLALVGCGLFKNDEPKAREMPDVKWGLSLQIGSYKLDSIFAPLDWNSYGNYYHVSMPQICITEPNCATAPRIGKIYGWDKSCFEQVEFYSIMGGGGVVPVDSLTGVFDFSSIFIGYQGGVTYRIWPTIKRSASDGRDMCNKDPVAIEVFFSIC